MEEEQTRTDHVPRKKVMAEELCVAGSTLELTNNQLMKMGDERLEWRAKLVEMSTMRFWMAVNVSSKTS